jgi:hypothetical protein
MSLASDELDESQITAMDLPLEFKVNMILSHLAFAQNSLIFGSVAHEIIPPHELSISLPRSLFLAVHKNMHPSSVEKNFLSLSFLRNTMRATIFISIIIIINIIRS